MDLNVCFSFGDESINNIAFIKALLMKKRIEELNIEYSQKEYIKEEVLRELKKLEIRENKN